MMHVYTDYVTYDAVVICTFHKEYVVNLPKICNYISSQRFVNIVVNSASFYLKQFQRYGVLKNVQLFWPTLYIHIQT